LNSNLLITELGAGNVIFGSTLDSDATARTLQVITAGEGVTRFVGNVGVQEALASLRTDDQGRTEFEAAQVHTDGNQLYEDDVVVFAALTRFFSGNIEFSETLVGSVADRDVEFITAVGGVTRFRGNVGANQTLGDLTTNGDSRTEVGGLVETTGTQTYEDEVTVIADATFVGENVLFASTLRSNPAGNDVLIRASQLTRFGAAVGGGLFRLGRLETDEPGTTEFVGNAALTTGDQIYHDVVRLNTTTVFTGRNIDFDGGIEAAAANVDLIVTSENDGFTRFGDEVGAGAIPLRNIATNDVGRTVFAAGMTPGTVGIRTTGNQTYNDDVEIEADLTVQGSTISFRGDVDSVPAAPPAGLRVVAAADANFGDDIAQDRIGDVAPLSFLEITAGNNINLLVPTITTNGNSVTFNTPLDLLADLLITELGAGAVTFNDTINSDLPANHWALTVNTDAGATNFNGAIGAVNPLSRLQTDTVTPGTGPTNIGAQVIRTEGASITFNDPVVLTNDLLITELGPGDVTFNSTVNSDAIATPRSLEIVTPLAASDTSFNGAIGNLAPLRNLIARAPGRTFLDGPVINVTDATAVAGTDSILFEDNVVLTGNVVITVVGLGNVRFAGTVNSPGNRDLRVTTGDGDTFFVGNVGLPAGSELRDLTTDGGGDTQFFGTNVATIGNQFYVDGVIINATVTFEANAGNIEFDSTLNASANGFNVDVNSTGLSRFGGNVGTAPAPAVVPLINGLATNIGGTTQVDGALIRTAGTQTFRDAVTVTNSVTSPNSVTFQGANVIFEQTLNSNPDGGNDVIVDSPGQTVFRGAVGGGGLRLRNLTTNGGGTTFILGGSVNTSQTQLYDDAVLFQAVGNTTTLTGGSVQFNNRLDAEITQQNLEIIASGLTRFGNDVADEVGTLNPLIPILNLTTDAPGTTLINTRAVLTFLDQTYNDPVLLGADVTTRSIDDDVYLDQTVDSVAGSAFDLTVDRQSGSRPTIFNGNVGGPANALGDQRNLGNLTVLSNGPLSLVAAINTVEQITINILEGGAASAADDLTLAANAILRAGTNIVLNVGDDITFAAGSTAVANGNLTVTSDAGNNDAAVGTVVQALGVGGPLGANGLVRFIAGPDNDFFNIQLDRLRPGDNINFNGGANGPGNFTLVTDTASVDGQCNPVVVPLLVTNPPFGDSLNLFDTNQVADRIYSLNSAQVARDDGLVLTFTEIQQFELNAGSGDDLLNVQMPGLPSVVQFNGGLGSDQLDIIGSAGVDRISVDAITDLPVHRPFEIAFVEKLRVRGGDGDDVVVNRVGIPTLLEGQNGADILVGSGATDVIFGGAGVDTLIGGAGDDFLFPDHEYDGTLQGIVTVADGDVSAGGTGNDGAAPLNSPAATLATLDSVCSIETLFDGGAKKDVITWLQARLLFGQAAFQNDLMGPALAALNDADFILDPPAVAVAEPELVVNPSFEHWLDNLYQALLGRDFVPSELQYYAKVSAAGASREAIAQGFLNSPERRANFIDGWYNRYLGRPLDAGGRAYWLNVWAQQDGESVEAAILGSGEFFQRVGGTNQLWVEAMYSQVLGRTGSAAEVQFWVARAASTPRALIAKQFVTSDEYRLHVVASWYQNYLTRAPEAGGAQYWLNKLKTGLKAEVIQSSILVSTEFQQMPW